MRLSDRIRFWLVCAAHFVVDATPLYFPVYVAMANLDLRYAGMISTLAKILSNGLQPAFGYLADRLRGKTLVVAAVIMGPLFVSLIGTTQNYMLLGMFFSLGSIGISLFHPAGASIAGSLGGTKKNTSFSLFILVGTVGFATGGYVFSGFDAVIGYRHSYWLCLPALVFAGVYAAAGPGIPAARSTAGIRDFMRLVQVKARALGILYCTVVVRGAVQMGFNFALPTLLKTAGYGKGMYAGAGPLLFNFTGVALLPVAGMLADRYGERRVLVLTMVLSGPLLGCFVLLLHANPVLSLACLALGGAILASSNPVGVVMGQKLTPDREATTSSFLMGFGWMVGSVAPWLVGTFSKTGDDLVPEKLAFNLLLLAGLPLLAAGASLFLPGRTDS